MSLNNMRLFIAVNFDDVIKKQLVSIQTQLKQAAVSGNWTIYDNLHITLVFLGEISEKRAEVIKNIIDTVTVPAFRIVLNGSGRFIRGDGDIWWVGIEENDYLREAHSQLSAKLRTNGFDIENRGFTPHLTIARTVKLKPEYEKTGFSLCVPKINADTDVISLMRSHRINGRLVYTSIYDKRLRKEDSFETDTDR